MINLTSILPDQSARPRSSRRTPCPGSVFKNPLSVFIGGVTAVLMELAEPPRAYRRVGTHNFSFEIRSGGCAGPELAAMVTIYGARSTAEAMIARVRRMHDAVAGTTPSGEVYRANDPELLNWVQGTAAYGFLQAYHVYVQPLSLMERDRYYAEAVPAARLYGATSVPISEAELEMLFHATADRLEPSHIVFEFLSIMRSAPTSATATQARAAPAGQGRCGSGASVGRRRLWGLMGRAFSTWEAERVRSKWDLALKKRLRNLREKSKIPRYLQSREPKETLARVEGN